jgi:hypothetical protein
MPLTSNQLHSIVTAGGKAIYQDGPVIMTILNSCQGGYFYACYSSMASCPAFPLF